MIDSVCFVHLQAARTVEALALQFYKVDLNLLCCSYAVAQASDRLSGRTELRQKHMLERFIPEIVCSPLLQHY